MDHIENPVLGVCTGVAGAIQAGEVINFLTHERTALAGKLLVFDLYDMSFDTITIPKDQDCIDCGGDGYAANQHPVY